MKSMNLKTSQMQQQQKHGAAIIAKDRYVFRWGFELPSHVVQQAEHLQTLSENRRNATEEGTSLKDGQQNSSRRPKQ